MSSSSHLKMTFRPGPVAPVTKVQGSGTPKGADEVVSALKSACGSDSVVALKKDQPGDTLIIVKSEKLFKVLQFLRDDERFLCTMLQTVTGTDYLPVKAQAASGDTPAVAAREGKIVVSYPLWSFVHRHQVMIQVELDRERPQVDSACDLFRCANWYEREVYDLLGVEFRNHPCLERLLLPTDWVGHPLRRDYIFPTEYNGMKVPL